MKNNLYNQIGENERQILSILASDGKLDCPVILRNTNTYHNYSLLLIFVALSTELGIFQYNLKSIINS